MFLWVVGNVYSKGYLLDLALWLRVRTSGSDTTHLPTPEGGKQEEPPLSMIQERRV